MGNTTMLPVQATDEMLTVYKGNIGHGCHRKIVAIQCHHGWGPLQRTFSVKETEVNSILREMCDM